MIINFIGLVAELGPTVTGKGVTLVYSLFPTNLFTLKALLPSSQDSTAKKSSLVSYFGCVFFFISLVPYQSPDSGLASSTALLKVLKPCIVLVLSLRYVSLFSPGCLEECQCLHFTKLIITDLKRNSEKALDVATLLRPNSSTSSGGMP